MPQPENLLIVAASEHDANMLYATGMFVPDPFIFLRLHGKNFIVMSDLEIDRARRQVPHCHVLSLSRYQRKLGARGKKQAGYAQIIQEILREKKIHSVFVPHNFPLGLATELQRLHVKVKVKPDFFSERETQVSRRGKKNQRRPDDGRSGNGGRNAGAEIREDWT